MKNNNMEYIFLSAIIVCIVSKTFCGIGLSSLFCSEPENISTEDKMQMREQLNKVVTKNIKRGIIWLSCGLILFLLWIITVMLLGR